MALPRQKSRLRLGVRGRNDGLLRCLLLRLAVVLFVIRLQRRVPTKCWAIFLWYTGAHEGNEPKTISWAMRRGGSGGLAFARPCTRSGQICTVRSVSFRSAGA